MVAYATPVDLSHLVIVNKSMVAVEYEFEELDSQHLNILTEFDDRMLNGN